MRWFVVVCHLTSPGRWCLTEALYLCVLFSLIFLCFRRTLSDYLSYSLSACRSLSVCISTVLTILSLYTLSVCVEREREREKEISVKRASQRKMVGAAGVSTWDNFTMEPRSAGPYCDGRECGRDTYCMIWRQRYQSHSNCLFSAVLTAMDGFINGSEWIYTTSEIQ